jgi:hypothetical protein
MRIKLISELSLVEDDQLDLNTFEQILKGIPAPNLTYSR